MSDKGYTGDSEKFARYVAKCIERPSFIAYWVNQWCERFDRRMCDVCQELQCDEDTVVHILMCGAPREGQILSDVDCVCKKFGINCFTLLRLVLLCEPSHAKLPPRAPKKNHNRSQYP